MTAEFNFPPRPRISLVDGDLVARRQWATNVRNVGLELMDAGRALMAVGLVDQADAAALTALVGAIYRRLQALTEDGDK